MQCHRALHWDTERDISEEICNAIERMGNSANQQDVGGERAETGYLRFFSLRLRLLICLPHFLSLFLRFDLSCICH